MRSVNRSGLIVTAVCMVCATPAVAQNQTEPKPRKPFVDAIGSTKPVPLPPGGPAPRMRDGRVDLSGVWFAGNSGRALAWSTEREEPLMEDPIPFQPWAEAKIKGMTRTQLQYSNPAVNCMPKGVPGMFTANPHPFELITIPGRFVQLIEADNNWRQVHTDGRPHQKELEPLFNGDGVGHWEGDTLVIDSISIDERTWIEGNGWFHSNALHVIERIRRPSMNYLEYQFTIGDPKVLTKPWTSSWRQFSLGKEDLLENYCTNNENVEQFQKLVQQELTGKK